MTDIRKLRELAEKANDGADWIRRGRCVEPVNRHTFQLTVTGMVKSFDGVLDFVSAANPSAILALIDELEKYKKACDVSVCAWCGHEGPKSLEAIRDHIVVCEGHPLRVATDLVCGAQAERDAFKARCERAEDLLERCQERLDDFDESDALYCDVNAHFAQIPESEDGGRGE